ncbi:dihydrofolate reductase family protein [Glycomyces algeriensis]|uniref:Deaminase reductase n=1 Tax=Glycomyces algeriensis TaxID=256037 RepID=A0A9W6GAE0_9ACTN|nr:dihydrofolate reductase family protein [Glycomyces algeriensis]MDA1364481.1 dihydrofolate reductase family protein [Glycomyces algeriensis]MDR7350514.1 dihydrofolate reductase [Glycomyces algeriensis]GLI43222.1 deaminase reductase [Glycomyces algeriensis]
MGKLIVTEFMSIDGVGQAPGAPEEDPEGGFAYGGWQAPLIDRDEEHFIFEQAKGMDALLLGRRTYDIFAGYWPTAPVEFDFTALINRVPKFVASRTLESPLSWDNASLLQGDLAESVADLKDRFGHVHVIGSLELVQSLLRLGLVDHLNLWVYPLVLAQGKRVFADGAVPTALRLTESRVFANGTVKLEYETAGEPAVGDIDADVDRLT